MIKEVIQYAEFVEEFPAVRDWIDDKGREVLDKRPVTIPIQSLPAPSSMMELVHRLYREMHDNENYETFADAEDFDVPDELGIEMTDTPYEQDFDHIGKTAEVVADSPAVPAEPDSSTKVDS